MTVHDPPERVFTMNQNGCSWWSRIRKLQQIEQLDPSEKRQVLQVLDAYIERGKLKKKANQ
jgi:hypothetical protein